MKLSAEAEAEIARLRALTRSLEYYRAIVEATRARTPYKQFCKHPDRCANTGRCQAEYCCID